ncbi:MAG: hypothetical protein ACRDHE_13475 [Ktedonobacterales bacterium]
MRCEECGCALYEAGDVVPAGVYTRVDDASFRQIPLTRPGPLPASFDGHIAAYRDAVSSCACGRPTNGARDATTTATEPPTTTRGSQEEL